MLNNTGESATWKMGAPWTPPEASTRERQSLTRTPRATFKCKDPTCARLLKHIQRDATPGPGPRSLGHLTPKKEKGPFMIGTEKKF